MLTKSLSFIIAQDSNKELKPTDECEVKAICPFLKLKQSNKKLKKDLGQTRI